MVKHTQKIRRRIADELSVFDHFVGLALKGLRLLIVAVMFMYSLLWFSIPCCYIIIHRLRRVVYGM